MHPIRTFLAVTLMALPACVDPAGPGNVVRTGDGLVYRASTDILESFPIQLRTHVEILGDSLADGEYRLRAYLRPRAGVVQLDAGSAPLSVPRR